MKHIKWFTNWVRQKWGRRKEHVEKVVLTVTPEHTPADEMSSPDPARSIKPVSAQEPDIDFRRLGDLESYAENMNVPAETIETWISAGLLYPDETRIAEKMLQILRKKEGHRD